MSVAFGGLKRKMMPKKKTLKKLPDAACMNESDSTRDIDLGCLRTDMKTSSGNDDALFKEKNKYSLEFGASKFKFRSYAPHIFRQLRELYGISDESFADSMSKLKGGNVGDGKSDAILLIER